MSSNIGTLASLNPDSFGELFRQICADLTPMRDFFITVGVLYTTKVVIANTFDLMRASRVFLLPKLWPWEQNLPKKYGKWAVVTGCTEGIGEAFAKELGKRGCNVALVARNEAKMRQIAQEIESHGVQTKLVIADFSDKTLKIYEDIRDSVADLDVGILVNNVGVIQSQPAYFNEVDEETLVNTVQINALSVSLMSRMVLPSMEERGRGAVINMGSASMVNPLPLMASYAASKAYVSYLSEALSYEYARSGVKIVSLEPMYVSTRMVGYSSLLDRPSLGVPSAETYVRHALQTLGTTHRTTGYWLHGLQVWMAEMAPRWFHMYGALALNSFFRANAKKRT